MPRWGRRVKCCRAKKTVARRNSAMWARTFLKEVSRGSEQWEKGRWQVLDLNFLDFFLILKDVTESLSGQYRALVEVLLLMVSWPTNTTVLIHMEGSRSQPNECIYQRVVALPRHRTSLTTIDYVFLMIILWTSYANNWVKLALKSTISASLVQQTPSLRDNLL